MMIKLWWMIKTTRLIMTMNLRPIFVRNKKNWTKVEKVGIRVKMWRGCSLRSAVLIWICPCQLNWFNRTHRYILMISKIIWLMCPSLWKSMTGLMVRRLISFGIRCLMIINARYHSESITFNLNWISSNFPHVFSRSALSRHLITKIYHWNLY